MQRSRLPELGALRLELRAAGVFEPRELRNWLKLGVLLTGFGWVTDWLRFVTDYYPINRSAQGYSAMSWLGFGQNLFGEGDTAVLVIGWTLTIATIAGLAWIWWRGRAGALAEKFALAAVAIPLLAPHASAFDSGVAVLTIAVVVDRAGLRAGWPVPIFWALGVTTLFGLQLGFTPSFLLAVVIGIWALYYLLPRLFGSGPESEVGVHSNGLLEPWAAPSAL